jgi:putative endonuclease
LDNPLGSSLRLEARKAEKAATPESCEGGHFIAAFPMCLKDYGLAGQLQKIWSAAQTKGLPSGSATQPGLSCLHVFPKRSKSTPWQAKFMERFFYVYVLVSETNPSIHYTGITDDLSARLRDHNRGHCLHTAKHRPWRIETTIAFTSEAKARAFEKYLKSGSGREFARRHF